MNIRGSQTTNIMTYKLEYLDEKQAGIVLLFV